MAANTSGGRDEMGVCALRRCFNTPMDLFNVRVDSSNDLISTSMVCCERSQEVALVVFIKK
jgi:hypothetical protein